MNNLKIILSLNSLPLIIGIGSQLLYFHCLKKYFTLSFFLYKKDLGVAMLAYSVALFGIVATISTVIYGLNNIATKKYLDDYGDYYCSSWLIALIYLMLTAFTSVLLLATTSDNVVIWILRLTLFLFIASLIQSLLAMWTGINLLKKKQKDTP